MMRTLARIDAALDRAEGRSAAGDAARAIAPFIATGGIGELDLQAAGIRTVIWATGYVRHYPWLAVPVLDGRGEIVHHGGITPAPGLYALGLRYMRRRRSHFISGCGRDAEELAQDIAVRLRARARAA